LAVDIEPGDFREREWAGATFEDAGTTLAITGRWRDGTL
jgi:hypothetical protein